MTTKRRRVRRNRTQRIVAVALGQSFYGGLFRSSLSRLPSSLPLLPHRHSSRVLGSADPYAFRKPLRSSAHFKASPGVDQRAAVQIDNAIHSYSVTRFRLSLLYAWEPMGDLMVPAISSLPFSKKRDSSPWWIVPILFIRLRKYRSCCSIGFIIFFFSNRKWKIFWNSFMFSMRVFSILLINIQIFFNSFVPSYQKCDKQFVELGSKVSTRSFAVESRSDSSELVRVKGLLRKRLDKFANG